MSRLRKSQQPPETEEEHMLTGQEPDTSRKVAEGSVLECLHQLRDNNAEGDLFLKDVAEALEKSSLRPKLSHQEWYTVLRTVRDGSNCHKDLKLILNEIDTRAAEFAYTERGIVDSVL
jgi:hypothetical protein